MSDGAALDLTFAEVGGRTVLTRRRHRWPLLIGRVFTDAGMGSVTVQNAAGTVIPGDVLTQRIRVTDRGCAVVRGQGATMVTGVPGGRVAVEDTDLQVDVTGTLWFDAAPRILTPHARYRQHMRVSVAPGGRAVLVDAVVLHPDLTAQVFGSYESVVEIATSDGLLLAQDTQVLETLPRVRRAPTAFATVYVVGAGLDTTMTALSPQIEAMAVLTGPRHVYVGVGDLPNAAGWAVRISAADGGILRTTIEAVTRRVWLDEGVRMRAQQPVRDIISI